jgi:WD40 repeat protein
VRFLSWSGDGRTIVALDDNSNLCGWDAATGHRRWTVSSAGWAQSMVCLGGDRVVLGTTDGYRIRRIADGALVARLIFPEVDGNRRWKRVFAGSPDGKLWATGGGGDSVQLWPSSGEGPMRELPLGGEAAAVGFTGDGSSLVAVRPDGVVRKWLLSAPESAVQITLAPLPATDPPLLLSPDAALVVGTSIGLSGWSTATGTLMWKAHAPSGNVAISGDGSRIVAMDGDRILELDAATGAPARETPHSVQAHVGAPAPDGRRFAAAFRGGAISVWDLEKSSVPRPEGAHFASIHSLCFTRDGAALVSSSADGRIATWDWRKARLLRVWDASPFVGLAAPLEDGRILTVDTEVRLLDPATGDTLHSVPGGATRAWRPMAPLSRDRRRVAVSAAADGARLGIFRILDTSTLAALSEIPRPAGDLHSAALSPDGSRFAATFDDQTVMIWSTADGRLEGSVKAPEEMSYRSSVTWDLNGIPTLAGGVYRQRRIAEGGLAIRLLEYGSLLPGCEPWSADGSFAMPAWNDGTEVNVRAAKEWWRKRTRFRGLPGRPTALAWSPDARALATGGSDGSILVWDAGIPDPNVSAEEVGPPRPPEVSPESRLLVHFAFDGTLDGTGVAPTRLAPGRLDFAPRGRGSALRLTAGPTSRSLEFDETEVLSPGDAWTIQFRFRVECATPWTAESYVRLFRCDLASFDLREGDKPGLCYFLPRQGGHGAIRFPQPVKPDTWYHVALVAGPEPGRLRLFVDGARFSEETTGMLARDLGRLSFSTSPTRGPAASLLLDDFAIYAGARTEAQIARDAAD